ATNTNVYSRATAAVQLAVARTALVGLQLRLKPEHPDVVRAKRTIAELERKAEAEPTNPALAALAGPVAPVASMTLQEQTKMLQLRTEHDSLDRRIAVAGQDQ